MDRILRFRRTGLMGGLGTGAQFLAAGVSSLMASTASTVCASSSTISPEASLASSSSTIFACIFSSILTLNGHKDRRGGDADRE